MLLNHAPWRHLPAGRRQLLAEQHLLEAEAAAEAQRLLERQREELEAKKRDSFKRAAESGVTAGRRRLGGGGAAVARRCLPLPAPACLQAAQAPGKTPLACSRHARQSHPLLSPFLCRRLPGCRQPGGAGGHV